MCPPNDEGDEVTGNKMFEMIEEECKRNQPSHILVKQTSPQTVFKC